VVVVVLSGRPLDLRWADEHVPAIVQAWYPGTRGGDAIASILVGDVSPAGRLPFTWPRHVGQVPLVYSHYRTFAPEDKDARYFEESGAPLYSFGHGLSYAAFEYTDLRLDRDEIAVGETATVSVDRDQHLRHATATRWCSSTSTRGTARQPGQCANSRASSG
jgi:beta-glucosidase